MSATAEQRREGLVELFEEVKDCTRCPLHETRTKAVFGAGNADAELMFVGEAPGAEEDRQGLPFVGRAGQLLNQMLEEIGLSREDVFIANVLKSRPARQPRPAAGSRSRPASPYLFEQVRLIEPRVVCTLGNFATKLLSGNPAGITRVRGTPQVHELGGRAVFLLPLFHPAAALRTPAVKETLRGDFATIPGLLAGPAPSPGAERRGGRRARGRGRLDPAAARRPAGHLRVSGGELERRSAAETEALGARDRRRASAPVTSSSSPATSAPARRPWSAAPAGRSGSRSRSPRRPSRSASATAATGSTVSHLDLYRLAGLEDEDPALLDDYLDRGHDRLRRVAGGGVRTPAAARRSRCGCVHGGGDGREIELDSASASARRRVRIVSGL